MYEETSFSDYIATASMSELRKPRGPDITISYAPPSPPRARFFNNEGSSSSEDGSTAEGKQARMPENSFS